MSLIALTLNLLLASLLLAAVIIGVRLERRLKAVREGQLAFAVAVSELDQAATKAKTGLADLRAATDESTDFLGGRIKLAREASDRLEKLLARVEAMPQPALAAPRLAAPPAAPPMPAAGPEGGLAALLQQLRASEHAPPMQAVAQRMMEERPLRVRRPADDDLFDDAGGRA